MPSEFGPAPLWRRLAALLYDAFLIAAALIILAFVWKLLLTLLQLETRKDILDTGYRIILFSVLFGFYPFFWLRGGQSLGMTAWKLKLTQASGNPLTLRDTVIRSVTAIASAACLGLGYVWCLFDTEKRSWHDILSKTRIIQITNTTQQNYQA